MTMPTVSKTWVYPTGSGTVYNSGVGDTDAKTALLATKNLMCQALVNSELLASGGWTSADWTGAHPTWTHTPGNTTPLSNTLAAIQYRYYTVAYTVSGWTTGDFTITFGGGSSGAKTATGTWSAVASNTNPFVVTPSNGFDGTIQFSVKGAIWSAVYGCDGSAAAAAGDPWVDVGDFILSNGVGSAHSWIVLYNHVGSYYLKHELVATNTNEYWRWMMDISDAAYTGGSKTSSPTTLGNSMVLCAASGMCWLDSTTQKVLHVTHSDDGQCTRVFLCQGGKCVASWFFETIKNPVSGIVSGGVLDKLAFLVTATNATTDCVTYATLITTASWKSYCTGSGAVNFKGMATGAAATAASILTAVNPRNSNTWLMSPLALFTISNPLWAYGLDGEVYDLWNTNATIITGDSLENDPATPTYSFICIGEFTIPWSGGTFTIS